MESDAALTGMMSEIGTLEEAPMQVPTDPDEDQLDLSFSDEELIDYDDGPAALDSGVSAAIPRQEQVQMIHLRRYLDYLADQVTEKEQRVVKTREELKRCKDQVEDLENQRDDVFAQIQTADTESNTAAVLRLRATHERLCEELLNEEELLAKIKAALDEAEYELSQAQVEQGKYQLADNDLQDREQEWERERSGLARQRCLKEQMLAEQADKRRKNAQKSHEESLRAQEDRQQTLVNSAKRSQEKHKQFYQQTMDKLRRRESEEEIRQKSHMEQRMKTMLALKGDIAANRENLRALQARDFAYARKDQATEDRQRTQILSEGGNPTEQLLKQKRKQEMEKESQQFAAVQREGQVAIAQRLIEEEERIKKRRQRQPYLWDDPKREKSKIVKPHKKPKLQAFEIYKTTIEQQSMADETDYPKRVVDEVAEDSDEDEEDGPVTSRTQDAPIPDSDSEDEGGNLAKPEFAGMWDKHKPYQVPKELDLNVKLPGASKMEKEILSKTLSKHREGIVIRQVAGGKEFKGQAFYSKPDVIHFKDFVVGKTYKKKVTLTNVSYTVNYCKFTGITQHLKDFIDIHFDPPGQMSAGLTCEMLVTFKPMINEDLEGVVNFLSQTGPFAIPVVCTTKKCDLKVDHSTIEFGTTVIGETLRRTFTLINDGALGTNFEFYKVTGLKHRSTTTAETSLGRLTTADSMRRVSPDTDEEKKGDKKVAKDKEQEKEKEKESTSDKKEKEEKGSEDATQKEKTESGEEGEEDEEGDMVDTEAADMSNASSDVGELASLDGMTVGSVASGDIGPHSTVKLEIVWQPTIPGRVDSEFLITFSDPLSENISVQTLANAVDVPVWVERHSVDLKICMFDRLYQDTILVNNRATTALRLKFEVCKELRDHLELLPKTGYIQAQSTFSAQLKFLPRASLAQDANKYFDKDTGVLEAPLVITVADQTRPVPFTVHAVVTNSDLVFDTTDVDFGCCTIYENVRKTIHLTNTSILPQKFGFVGIPNYVDVQPNDGFGMLLPLETVELHLIFKPQKARDYNFQLKCKSLINREFIIQCKGVGVHPPLELSQQVIHFAATALNDVSTATFHVVNSHTSMNEFTHPVPRIGKGEIAPVGPTSFEFVVPEDAPVTVAPSVGTVMPGKKCPIHVRFTPKLNDLDIRKEAVRMVTKTMELRAQEEHKAALQREKENNEQAQAKAKKPPPKGKLSGKAGEGGAAVSAEGPPPIDPPTVDNIDPSSDVYAAAQASLLRQYRSEFQSLRIPCYVASGQCTNPGELPYSIHNTLYLEVHCPAVKPQLVVISDNGRTTTDFGHISIGQSVIKSITVQNISSQTLHLSSSILDTSGPFQVLNALRAMPPDASHTLIVSFSPHQGLVFQEVLEVKTATSTLHITLQGRGVNPIVNLSIEGTELDMGSVIAGEYREETFKIMNTSTLSVHYSIKLDSQSLLQHSRAQDIPDFIDSGQPAKNLVGAQNYSGLNVFDCVPAEGVITSGGTQEIMITFGPDHASDFYSDGVRIELFGQEESHVFRVHGESKAHIMYITGGDQLLPNVQSLHIMPQPEELTDVKGPRPVLVTLHSVAKDTEFSPASRDIYVGCVRTMAVSQKKETHSSPMWAGYGSPIMNSNPGAKANGEYTFDSLTTIAALGFNIDPLKGMLEAGTKKPITITWTPPPGYDPTNPVETSINLSLAGDIRETYKIMLRALVVSE